MLHAMIEYYNDSYYIRQTLGNFSYDFFCPKEFSKLFICKLSSKIPSTNERGAISLKLSKRCPTQFHHVLTFFVNLLTKCVQF